MSAVQLRLPLKLECCNPHCKNETYHGHQFCGDTCYWEVEKLNRLGATGARQPVR